MCYLQVLNRGVEENCMSQAGEGGLPYLPCCDVQFFSTPQTKPANNTHFIVDFSLGHPVDIFKGLEKPTMAA